MNTENSKKSKSSAKTASDKKSNVETAQKSGTKNLDKNLELMDVETWDYMNEVEDLKYEY